ncbi:MAG: Asp-tRNA(Asn)/Glu-tRNA(Gln) amidotransferase subunit GatB, partial [Bdellovibrio sp.]
MALNDFEAVIGLEIHAQLKTQSKMFCSDSTDFHAGDNQNISPVSVGFPGTLPVINRTAVEYAIKAGLALDCQIRKKSVFSRKNYFYPDLPKGYQISQYDEPICEKGQLSFLMEGQVRRIGITRAHLEEDAGKSQHLGDRTLINYNRSGIPLLEIVSEPEIRSPQEAAEYAKAMRQVLRFLDVCDGNLEEGSLRCDCNVSVRLRGATRFGTKVEIKNINSFRFVEKALEYEIQRQIDLLENGEKISQETRLYDPDKNRTFSMRSKEDAQDYRYFPDPDLMPLVLETDWIDTVRASLPELPLKMRERFIAQYGLSEYDCDVLISERELALYFEEVAKISKNPKASANWIMTEVLRELKEKNRGVHEIALPSEKLGRMIQMIDRGDISGKIAK